MRHRHPTSPFPTHPRLCALVACFGLLPGLAHAWWNDDFKHRTRIVFNTTAAGVETNQPLAGVTVPLRLHSGNFDFLAAKPDGAAAATSVTPHRADSTE